jgi:hypothetical protein
MPAKKRSKHTHGGAGDARGGGSGGGGGAEASSGSAGPAAAALARLNKTARSGVQESYSTGDLGGVTSPLHTPTYSATHSPCVLLTIRLGSKMVH